MQTAAPPLRPLLRSRLRAELLTIVLLHPNRERTLTELADLVGGAVSSTQREVARADQTDAITSRRLGNTRLVRAAPSPLTAPLTELLLRSFGPKQVIAEELATVEASTAFMSSAPGPPATTATKAPAPNDIDVLVIGQTDRNLLDDAAERAERRLARPLNITIRSTAWWRTSDDGFRIEIAKRPLLAIREARQP